MMHLPDSLPLKMSGESDEIEKLKSKIEALKDFKARAVPAIKTAHEKFDTMKKELDGLTELTAKLRGDHVEVTKEKEALKKEMAKLKDEKEKLKHALTTKEKEIQNAKGAINPELGREAIEEVQKSSEKIASLEVEVETLRRQLEDARATGSQDKSSVSSPVRNLLEEDTGDVVTPPPLKRKKVDGALDRIRLTSYVLSYIRGEEGSDESLVEHLSSSLGFANPNILLSSLFDLCSSDAYLSLPSPNEICRRDTLSQVLEFMFATRSSSHDVNVRELRHLSDRIVSYACTSRRLYNSHVAWCWCFMFTLFCKKFNCVAPVRVLVLDLIKESVSLELPLVEAIGVAWPLVFQSNSFTLRAVNYLCLEKASSSSDERDTTCYRTLSNLCQFPAISRESGESETFLRDTVSSAFDCLLDAESTSNDDAIWCLELILGGSKTDSHSVNEILPRVSSIISQNSYSDQQRFRALEALGRLHVVACKQTVVSEYDVVAVQEYFLAILRSKKSTFGAQIVAADTLLRASCAIGKFDSIDTIKKWSSSVGYRMDLPDALSHMLRLL